MSQNDRRINIRVKQNDLDELAAIRDSEGLSGFAAVLRLLLAERSNRSNS